ncbi:MAG: bifunctional DNA-formamidopyrimidine glycosylase/DNA-(apurinic or apyrimidinic site) lyase [Candidatus Eremiobacteraeota bacterium]|nr:bifunctional DNA-formamidopyrimidine glycosylase/DNA-(apurinic or apyrimidinic site) lyase [Candidatus Eremiobacteraeota bacterium]
MPELPEVETIVRGLARSIVGTTIDSADVRLARIAVAPPGIGFSRAVAGERIAGVRRRGKYAVIELASGGSLVTSLRMTGRLVVARNGEPEWPSTHLVLRLRDGARLRFSDVRTFGRMRFVRPGEAWDRDLGMEPLSSGFTDEAFMGMLSGRSTPIKALLLDQRRIAGIGNIYAFEALWEARIRPSRPAGRLTKPAAFRLHHAIVDVLQRAIEMRGTSVDDYVDADGLQGGFQNNLSVYGRNGRLCPRCGKSRIVRTVLAQRGTWWCRQCQR